MQNHHQEHHWNPATPIQLGSYDLFVLLNILRPDLIIDQESFEHMAEPNSFINHAIDLVRMQKQDWAMQAAEKLDEAAATSWGLAIFRHNPEFSRIHAQLSQNAVSMEERVRLITDIEDLHTFSGIIDRTVVLDKRLYEGPVELIGKQVELLFHEEERDLVEIRYKQQSYGILKQVDLNVNCRVKRDKNNDPVISGGNSTPQSGRIWEVES